jgi:hypothetical protein
MKLVEYLGKSLRFVLPAMRRLAPVWGVLVLCPTGQGADQPIDYATQIKPILVAKCFACHGALKEESGLRLDAASLIRRGGDSGLVIVAGRAAESLLINKVSSEDPDERMPPEGDGEPLTADQVALLKQWIDQGAAAPDEPIPPNPRDHWAYQTPLRRDIPKPHNAGWVRNDVDAFLATKHEAVGLKPAPTAAKEELLRRLYLDLVGLPPTRKELHAFLADPSPQAYELVVDRLLDSPQYGERWGRHWMDVWRYSDWAGFGNEIRYSQRHIWRWRDWIVESLNADKGYDRMILEMLAADGLAPGDDDAIRATGFLARSWYKFDRNVWLDDVIEHTGKAFLAATFKCARCHDHKYDPISQQEYYRLRAIFEPYDVRTDRVPGELDVNKDGLARIFDAKPDAATYFVERGDHNHADEEHPVLPGVPAVLGGELTIQPVSLPLEAYYPAMRDFVAREMIAQAEAAITSAATELAAAKEPSITLAEKKVATARAQHTAIQSRVNAEIAKHKADPASSPPLDSLAKAAAKAERIAKLADADEKLLGARRELQKALDAGNNKAVGAAKKKIEAAKKAFDTAKKATEQESSSYEPLGPSFPKIGTGRRLALARWIVDRRNPLTARVMVNHIWLRHFGRALVEGVDDFGLRSPRPPLADLLDYLAVELMENRWSMKHVHRLVVTSNAYRMSSSAGRPANPSHETDLDNKLFWRMNAHRMEAETVRDAVLHVAGSLDLMRGGPDIDHNQGLTVPRRSLYFRHARERQMEFLRMFDAATPRECYRRRASIRPQQAFAMVNSSLTLAQSRKLAGQLVEEGDGTIDESSFVVAAFETVLSRRPNDDELQECRKFLALQTKQLADTAKMELLGNSDNTVPPSSDPAQRARENLLLVLLNHNDFVTVR